MTRHLTGSHGALAIAGGLTIVAGLPWPAACIVPGTGWGRHKDDW